MTYRLFQFSLARMLSCVAGWAVLIAVVVAAWPATPSALANATPDVIKEILRSVPAPVLTLATILPAVVVTGIIFVLCRVQMTVASLYIYVVGALCATLLLFTNAGGIPSIVENAVMYCLLFMCFGSVSALLECVAWSSSRAVVFLTVAALVSSLGVCAFLIAASVID